MGWLITEYLDGGEWAEQVYSGVGFVSTAEEVGVEFLVPGEGEASGFLVGVIAEFVEGIINNIDGEVGHPVDTV